MDVLFNKQPRSINRLEGRLQAECVIWYRNVWYKNPKHLWATFNEGKDVTTKMSLGLTPYVSDLLYYEHPGRGLIGIEMKYPGETHEVSRILGQAKWILEVCSQGGFCDSLELFQKIIRGESNGIDPKRVIQHCSLIKTKSIVWSKSLFEN